MQTAASFLFFLFKLKLVNNQKPLRFSGLFALYLTTGAAKSAHGLFYWPHNWILSEKLFN